MKLQEIEWKESLVKSIIYRLITLILGTLTAYIITGSLAIATGTAILTESVQAINYFVFEIIWSNIARRRLEEDIIQRIKRREIDLRLDFSSIKEFAYQLSQIDTFIPKLYLSIQKIFKSMMKNEELEEIHEEIENYKESFERIHSGRKMFFLEEKE